LEKGGLSVNKCTLVLNQNPAGLVPMRNSGYNKERKVPESPTTNTRAVGVSFAEKSIFVCPHDIEAEEASYQIFPKPAAPSQVTEGNRLMRT
jgi:hypothetical protein